MRKKPVDVLSSVDNALRLLHLLRDQGIVSVSEAATALDVSVSSAHRLLATLVYRDFAAQDEGRRYRPGPAMSLQPGLGRPVAALRDIMNPVMQRLSDQLGETITLSVRIDTRVRVITAAEAPRMLRVVDQEGTVLPAHLTSSGKAMLAFLTTQQLRELYESSEEAGVRNPTPSEWRRLLAELSGVRQNGFAVNHGEAEQGVTAIGVPVRGEGDRVLAGIATTMPSARFAPADIAGIVAAMTGAIREVAQELGRLSEPTVPAPAWTARI